MFRAAYRKFPKLRLVVVNGSKQLTLALLLVQVAADLGEFFKTRS
jgi:hypothetical protein